MKIKKLAPLFAAAMAFVMTTEVFAQSGMEIGDAVEESSAAASQEYVYGTDTVSDDSLLLTETTYTESGSKAVSKMSKTTIANYIKKLSGGVFENFTETPSVKAPYTTGKVTDECLDYALQNVNLMRMLAGVPGVTLRDEYVDICQHGAVLLAATNRLTHNPSKPDDMDVAFYNKGYKASSQSNIAYGSPSGYYQLPSFTKGYMKDNTGSNVNSVGHRRWILNPEMSQTGFGYAISESNSAYGTLYAFDSEATVPDYDFIAWPSSGNFPSLYMGAGDPWSVTLNPKKFKTKNMTTSNIVVTVTSSGGTSRTFTASDEENDVNNSSLPFYTIDTRGYGVANCIIFRPGTDLFGSGELSGNYTVVISGLQDSMGVPATICYTVDFFNYTDYITLDEVPDLSKPNPVMDDAKVAAFISRLYNTCIGRSADGDEIKYWKDLMMDRQRTGAQVAQEFFFGPEMTQKGLTDKKFIEILYAVMMDREPEPDETDYWIDLMKKGSGRTGIFAEFAVSPEFTGICKDYGIERGTAVISEGRDRNVGATQFIARLYTEALERGYDVAGLNYWCDCLINKTYSASEIAAAQFFHSSEFVGRGLGDSDYIKVLYRTFMGRTYDDAGLDYWLYQMRVCGMSRDDVLDSFAVCPEFKQIMAAYGM